MGFLRALLSGVSGAVTVCGLRAALARWAPGYAPDIHRQTADLMKQGFRRAKRKPPGKATLRSAAVAADVATDTLAFSLVGLGDPGSAWLRGLGIGTLAGAAALGVSTASKAGKQPIFKRPTRSGITIGLYTLAGLVAGLMARLIPSGHHTVGEHVAKEQTKAEAVERMSGQEFTPAGHEMGDESLGPVVAFEGH